MIKNPNSNDQMPNTSVTIAMTPIQRPISMGQRANATMPTKLITGSRLAHGDGSAALAGLINR